MKLAAHRGSSRERSDQGPTGLRLHVGLRLTAPWCSSPERRVIPPTPIPLQVEDTEVALRELALPEAVALQRPQGG